MTSFAPASKDSAGAAPALPAPGSGTQYFPTVKPIKYEGPTSINPLAFRYYNAEQKVLGKVIFVTYFFTLHMFFAVVAMLYIFACIIFQLD